MPKAGGIQKNTLRKAFPRRKEEKLTKVPRTAKMPLGQFATASSEIRTLLPKEICIHKSTACKVFPQKQECKLMTVSAS
jgi:hypothetical protein